MFALQLALNDKNCAKVGSFAVENCNKSMKILKKIKANSEARLTSNKSGIVLESQDVANEACKEGLSHAAVLDSMLSCAKQSGL